MATLAWDAVGEKLYETGVEKGVLYTLGDAGAYTSGVAWNGLNSVTESPSGAEATALYADNTKYLNLYSAEEFGGTIAAYMYPPEFEKCDGSADIETGVTIGQQSRSVFGLCYRTVVGNDVKANNYGYKLHLVYGCQVSPSEKEYSTINDSPEAITFSWEFKTTPVPVTGFKPTSTVTIDSVKAGSDRMAAIEAVLYGNTTTGARLPLPDEVAEIMDTTKSSGS